MGASSASYESRPRFVEATDHCVVLYPSGPVAVLLADVPNGVLKPALTDGQLAVLLGRLLVVAT